MRIRILAILALGSASLFGQSLVGIIPSTVAAGTPSFSLQLNGGPFCSASYAVYQPPQTGSQQPIQLSTSYLSSSSLIATVPASLVADQKVASIYVNNFNCNSENTNSVYLTVGPAVAILPDTMPYGNVASLYSMQFQGLNGNGPYNFVLLSDLPGFTLDFNTGILTGTPKVTGDTSVTIQATDRLGARAQRTYIFHVEAQLLDISTLTLPRGTVGVPYDQFVKAAGGLTPYTFFFVQGNLPPGLALKSDNSGEILGTPTVVGTYTFTMGVRDSASAVATRSVTLIIDPVRATINPDTLPNGNVNVFYSQALTVTGGSAPFNWTIISSDNDGFRIDSSSGVFTGTASNAGTFHFTVQATDRNGLVTQKAYTLIIVNALAISTASLPDGVVGTSYSAALAATGSTAPFTWSILTGALPDGLALDTSTGKITGTPTKVGAFAFQVRVSIATGATAQKDFRITITAPLTPLLITTTLLPQGNTGKAYTATVAATGGTAPYTFSAPASALPPGLSFDGKTGTVSGTPTTAGNFAITFTVTDSTSKTATKDLSIRVVAPLAITPTTLPTATVGQIYTQTLTASGGIPPYRFASNLPTGFTLDPATGVFTGTPTTTDPLVFTVSLFDALGPVFLQPYTIAVNLPALPTPTIGGLPATSLPVQQPNVTLTLGDVFPVDITGTLTLTFTSAVGGSDDTVQFTTGGRTAAFRIPAGTKTAVFTAANVGVVTGTVAGTITVRAALNASGTDVTPTPAPVQRIVVDQAPPVITKVILNTTSTGYEVLVTGYSTTRSMVRGTFTFAATSNANLQTTSLQVALDTAFVTWFNSAASNATGGQFTLTMPFTTSGPSNAVSSVTVVLTNARGDSNAKSPQ